jgi:hypothetical protein
VASLYKTSVKTKKAPHKRGFLVSKDWHCVSGTYGHQGHTHNMGHNPADANQKVRSTIHAHKF